MNIMSYIYSAYENTKKMCYICIYNITRMWNYLCCLSRNKKSLKHTKDKCPHTLNNSSNSSNNSEDISYDINTSNDNFKNNILAYSDYSNRGIYFMRLKTIPSFELLQDTNIKLENLQDIVSGYRLNSQSKNTYIYLYKDNVYKFYTIRKKKHYLKVIKTLCTSQEDTTENSENIILPEYIYSCDLDYCYPLHVEVYPYYKDGDLFNYICHKNLSDDDIWIIYKQVITIIQLLHNRGVTHRDIKAENFLIKYDENSNPIIKITDFDYASLYNKDLNFRGGSHNYVSPQVLADVDITDWRYNDVWSCGILLYILIFNEVPWQFAHTTNEQYCEYLANYGKFWKYRLFGRFSKNGNYYKIYLNILKNSLALYENDRCDINYIQDQLNIQL